MPNHRPISFLASRVPWYEVLNVIPCSSLDCTQSQGIPWQTGICVLGTAPPLQGVTLHHPLSSCFELLLMIHQPPPCVWRKTLCLFLGSSQRHSFAPFSSMDSHWMNPKKDSYYPNNYLYSPYAKITLWDSLMDMSKLQGDKPKPVFLGSTLAHNLEPEEQIAF